MVAAAAVMHGAALLRFARQSGPYEPEMLLDWLGVRTNRSLEDCQVMIQMIFAPALPNL